MIVTGLVPFIPFAGSNQADDTTIRIIGFTPGVTPFVGKVNLSKSKVSCWTRDPLF